MHLRVPTMVSTPFLCSYPGIFPEEQAALLVVEAALHGSCQFCYLLSPDQLSHHEYHSHP